jgi:hypothetical protein
MTTQRQADLVDVYVRRSFDEVDAPEQGHPDSARLEQCLVLLGIRRERSYLTPDGNRMLCHFRTPDAESLRMALRVAGIDYDGLWTGSLKNIPEAAEFELAAESVSQPKRRQ